MRRKNNSSDVIEISKIEDYSWQRLMDMAIYEVKKFKYPGGNFVKFLLEKKENQDGYTDLKHISSSEIEIRLSCCKFTYRVVINKENGIVEIRCVVPCRTCKSEDTHVYLDEKEYYLEDKDSNTIECFCLSCEYEFDI